MTAPGPWNVQQRRAVPRLYSLAWFFYLLLAATAVVWIGTVSYTHLTLPTTERV